VLFNRRSKRIEGTHIEQTGSGSRLTTSTTTGGHRHQAYHQHSQQQSATVSNKQNIHSPTTTRALLRTSVAQTVAGLETFERREEKGKSIIDKQEHTPHAFSEVSTSVDYSQNRRSTFAVYSTSPAQCKPRSLTPIRLPRRDYQCSLNKHLDP
jgi:hypothetical protein